ncbi:hypothetical protein [Acidiferrobacter sp.]|uniref:DUF6967 family protein n=1 Tax=Acidiferrobacter sp. TaxID=1872107 RepID=UPI00345B635F
MEQITAPSGQVIELRQVFHETGARLLRVIIRDGAKYFTVELDAATAHDWGARMQDWARASAEPAQDP